MADDDKTKAGSATTIGPTIIIRGKLKVDEDLIVRGRIEAEILSSKALVLENSGIVKANVRAKSARVSGVVVGNIGAEEKIEIAADGRVVGDLLAPRIIISDGAAFRGRIEMQGSNEGRESKSNGASTPAEISRAEPALLAAPEIAPPSAPAASSGAPLAATLKPRGRHH